MSLISDLAREHSLPVLINIHDVGLGLSFAQRIIGLSQGEIVFDGSPDQVNEEILTGVFGESDWRQTIRHAAEDVQARENPRKLPANEIIENAETIEP